MTHSRILEKFCREERAAMRWKGRLLKPGCEGSSGPGVLGYYLAGHRKPMGVCKKQDTRGKTKAQGPVKRHAVLPYIVILIIFLITKIIHIIHYRKKWKMQKSIKMKT